MLKFLSDKSDGASITLIMYNTNINCSLLNWILDYLISRNTVEKRVFGVHVRFFILPLGRHALELYDGVKVLTE